MKKLAIIISVAAVAAAVISGAVLSVASVNAKADETYIEEGNHPQSGEILPCKRYGERIYRGLLGWNHTDVRL